MGTKYNAECYLHIVIQEQFLNRENEVFQQAVLAPTSCGIVSIFCAEELLKYPDVRACYTFYVCNGGAYRESPFGTSVEFVFGKETPQGALLAQKLLDKEEEKFIASGGCGWVNQGED